MAPSVGKPLTAAQGAEDDLLPGASREEWFGRVSQLRETVFLDGSCAVLALRSG